MFIDKKRSIDTERCDVGMSQPRVFAGSLRGGPSARASGAGLGPGLWGFGFGEFPKVGGTLFWGPYYI